MKIIIIIFSLIFTGAVFSQSISESEIFNLTYKEQAEANNLRYDNTGTNYCYVYKIKDENKSFLISKNTLSEKYDYTDPADIRFDSEGNYYTVTSDYVADYGENNYFLIANGKVVKNYNYIESYSSYINKKNEFVFIFKENELYRIGYYSLKSGFRQSDEYQFIKVAYNNDYTSRQMEGDEIPYNENQFFKSKNGERVYIATISGKTKIIFESNEIQTDYGDINETSLSYNKNDEISYIAKKSGRFYEYTGNEFVVSGNKVYDNFELVSLPLKFNENNEPVYIAGDSLTDKMYNYFPVIGNQIQKATAEFSKTDFPPDFGNGISEMKIKNDGSITYVGISDYIIPSSEGNIYDVYFSNSFFVDEGNAYELGYNLNKLLYSPNGDLLYSGIADVTKNERLLLLNYGSSKIIINKDKFDDIFEYGFTPSGELFYVGQNFEDSAKGKKYESVLFIGDKKIGTYDFLIYQYFGDSVSLISFDSKSNFAFVLQEFQDSLTAEYRIITEEGKLPVPENISKSKILYSINNLMFTGNDNLFFIADTKLDPETYDVQKEVFVNNKSLGKIYNSISDLKYDVMINEISFTGSRGKNIYQVRVKL